MSTAHLDTHVVVWLAAELVGALSRPARRAVEQAERVEISPMVIYELAVLHELGRLDRPPAAIVGPLTDRVGLAVSDLPFHEVVGRAATLDWTREPCDRLIAAQAEVAGASLVTKDRRIRAHCPAAVW